MPENKKIIFMDDDEIVWRVIKFMADRLGYDVSFTKNGEETIELYKESMKHSEPYSALVLDLNIDRGMGGEETIKKLLTLDPRIKVIVSSGDCYDPVMINFQKFGFVSSVGKPFDLGKLDNALSKAVNGH
jgi:two-component system, cell cycle sensor histidine kinase and response regulator CckA